MKNIREGPDGLPESTVVTDVHIAAFLRYRQWSYILDEEEDMIKFVFPREALNDIGDYYDDQVNKVPVMEYVELLKKVKGDLYEAKNKKERRRKR